jgi:hypothetical protein
MLFLSVKRNILSQSSRFSTLYPFLLHPCYLYPILYTYYFIFYSPFSPLLSPQLSLSLLLQWLAYLHSAPPGVARVPSDRYVPVRDTGARCGRAHATHGVAAGLAVCGADSLKGYSTAWSPGQRRCPGQSISHRKKPFLAKKLRVETGYNSNHAHLIK